MATVKKPGDTSSSSKPGTGQPSRPGAPTVKPTAPAPKTTTPPKTGATVGKPVTGPYVGETYRRGVTTGQGSGAYYVAPGSTQPAGGTGGGGGGTGGGGGGTGTNVQPAAVATPVDWEQAAIELYGGYYSIIQSVPELQDLLRKAIGPPAMSDAQFEYALRQTNWWKQNAASARQWDVQSQTDPATADQQVTNRIVELQNIAASQFQVQLDEQQLRKLATDSLRFNWTEQMVTNAIGLEATKSSAGLSQLASGFVGQTVKQTANAYGLKLSEDSLNQWVSAIATGQTSQQGFQQYAVNTAKNLFPAISSQLDSGLTFQQVVDPFKNVAAQILEISPDGIDFVDPKWARAISTVDNGGQQRMMSFSEWGDYLRNERSFGYEYTSDAQQKAYEVANNLANLFGRV